MNDDQPMGDDRAMITADPSGDAVRVYEDREALCRAAARELLRVLSEAVASRGSASAVLTGGGTGTGILAAVAGLLEEERAPDWSRVHLWWGDERYLAAGDPDRNEVQAAGALVEALVTRHGMPAGNVHAMPAADGSGPDAAAGRYAAELARHAEADPGPDARLPAFDVVMLGVGPDAHVASLFPGLPGPTATGSTVIGVEDSPKPPPLRISLTVEALNTARRLWFVVAGADKREAVAAVRGARNARTTDAARWPASVVSGGMVTTWWLDGAAAG
ncbi:MAG: 6-phosphogluconolactonase [Micrococcus sp.]|nr:6-phosphogluconolactonase [Micrococcus sp.]